MEKLILASASPRRVELLPLLGIPFSVHPADCDEALPPMPADQAVLCLSRRKAEAVAALFPGHWVLGADTLVSLGGQALGKPRDEEEARSMIRSLSGREHTVFTGLCLADPAGRPWQAVEATGVRFVRMSEEEIGNYAATGESLDKAGGYALQGRAAVYISGITGCPYNAIGLPLARLRLLLAEAGFAKEGWA